MNKELKKFIHSSFPYASHMNPNCEYSEKEYKLAKKSLKPYLGYLKDLDEELLYKAFACLIRSITANKKDLDNMKDSDFTNYGKIWKQYHKMLPEFNMVLGCFTESFNPEKQISSKIFPVKEVVIKGANTNDKIILKGPILDIIKSMFIAFNDVDSEEAKQRMKEYSFELYDSYTNYQKEWNILNAEKEAIFAKQLIKNREETKKETALTKYRSKAAYYIYLFLNKVNKSGKKIPEWHKVLIGNLFIGCGIAHDERHNDRKIENNYIDISNYNTVRRWIEEGEKSVN